MPVVAICSTDNVLDVRSFAGIMLCLRHDQMTEQDQNLE